jgi:hypothetical protein
VNVRRGERDERERALAVAPARRGPRDGGADLGAGRDQKRFAC